MNTAHSANTESFLLTPACRAAETLRISSPREFDARGGATVS